MKRLASFIVLRKPSLILSSNLAKTLLRYENAIDTGELVNLDDSVKLEIRNSIKRHKAYIEGQYEDRLLNDARSPIGTLFTLKNNYGWVDKQEIVNTESKIEVKLED